MSSLHERLVESQSINELERKSEKACRHKQKLWTDEELDYISARAKEMAKKIKWL